MSDLGFLQRSAAPGGPVASKTLWLNESNGALAVWDGTRWIASVDAVNVRSYGAVGDGITDDTDAIQTAIAAVAGAGKSYRLVFPPTPNNTPYCISDTLYFEGNGYEVYGWGNRFSYACCLRWIGNDPAKDAVLIEHSYGARFYGLSVDGYTGTPPRYGIHLRSDNDPAKGATLDNLLIHPCAFRCGTAGIAVTGKTTGNEQVDGNTFLNPWMEDNPTNFLQTTGNSQCNTLILPRFGCNTLTYAGAETNYHIDLGGGSLVVYSPMFGFVKLSDIYVSNYLWGGLHVFGAYSESRNAFLTMYAGGGVAGGISIHGLYHTPAGGTPFAEQTDSIQIKATSGAVISITNADITYGDVRINNDNCDVILTNVKLDNGDVIEDGTNSRVYRIGANTQTTAVGSVGQFVDVPFNAGNFAGESAMTWTVAEGDVTTYQWSLAGKVMTVIFTLITTTVGGTPAASLLLKIPGGKQAAGDARVTIYANDAGTPAIGIAYTVATSTWIVLTKDTAGANWNLSTNGTGVAGQITFEVA